MPNELNWELLFSVAAGVVTAAWAIFEYREDRRWRRVQFLIDLNQRFFDSAEVRRCLRMLDDESSSHALARVLSARREDQPEAGIAVLEDFRVFLQFFDVMSRTVELGVIPLAHVNLFGWYLHHIAASPSLAEYCERNGFGAVTRLARNLEREVYARAG